jgi:hypothetical protein
MNKGNMIPVNQFCASHNIEISFISSLQEAGLIEITSLEEIHYIHESRLNELEKIIRLYYDLDINLEGIETVINLLHRLDDMQNEINLLRNRLRFYETFEF